MRAAEQNAAAAIALGEFLEPKRGADPPQYSKRTTSIAVSRHSESSKQTSASGSKDAREGNSVAEFMRKRKSVETDSAPSYSPICTSVGGERDEWHVEGGPLAKRLRTSREVAESVFRVEGDAEESGLRSVYASKIFETGPERIEDDFVDEILSCYE
ncbi:hypothetical protein HDU98_009941 [Podochytrium sp. JEL0797]|nr:hypothetical protein HDU98_009941 [Podochytrium sp. JEL0797]